MQFLGELMRDYKDTIKKQVDDFNENITIEKINFKLNQSKINSISPIRVLEYISNDYSGVWNRIEQLAIQNFTNLKWDKGIFVPVTYWLPTLLDIRYPNWHKTYKGKNMPIYGIDFISICAIGTWRYTKGIYKLDDEIAKHFFVDDSDMKIPSLLLEKQPEWSIFVETKNLDIFLDGQKVIGFWSNINCFPTQNSPYSDKKTLTIVPLFSDGVGYLLSASIPLSENISLTIEQATTDLVNDLSNNMMVNDHRSEQELKELNSFKKKIVQILLFIIQPEPDITEDNIPLTSIFNKPYPKSIKGKYRLFEAKKPRYFNVGTQSGNMLKKAFASYKATGKKQAPHIRKAHWHGYWKGSKKIGTQEFFYKWIPPVIVNSHSDDSKKSV